MTGVAEWRTGRKLGRTVYRNEVFAGLMETRELAELVVAALNGRERYIEPGDDLSVLPGCGSGRDEVAP